MSFLSSNELYDLAIVGDNIWCGTNGGVVIFNKQTGSPDYGNFTRMTTSDGLFSNLIVQAKQDNYGNIWCFCKEGGIVVYSADRSIKKKFTFRDGLPSYNFSSAIIKGDTVLVGTCDNAKLWLYDMKGGSLDTGSWYVKDILLSQGINEIKVLGDSIWFATNNGIGVTENFSDFVIYDTSDSLPGDTVFSIGFWNNSVWAGTNQGIATLNTSDTVWRVMDSSLIMYNFCSTDTALWGAGEQGTYRCDIWQQISGNRAKVLIVETQNLASLLWIGTLGNGLFKYDGNLQQYIPEGPPFNWFNSITADLNGDLWSSYRQNMSLPSCVISRLYREGEGWKWQLYNTVNEWGVNEIKKVLVDSKNNKWVFMWNERVEGPAIVKILPNDSIVKISFQGGGLANVVTGCYIDKNDNAWMGCHDGYIRRVNGNSNLLDTIFSNDYTAQVMALSLDSEENLWIGGGGGHSNGVTVLMKDGSCKWVENLPVGEVYFIYINEEVWVGMDRGLYKIKDFQIIQSFSTTVLEGLPVDASADSTGLWLAIRNNGIRKLENGNLTSYKKEDGLVSDVVLSIDFDPQNKVVWVGTLNGLSRCSLTDENLPSQRIKVYPNPFVVSRGHQKISFSSDALDIKKIDIYTLSGKLIKSIDNDTIWTVETQAGTGIYLFVAQGKDGKKERGKFAIVR